MSFVYNTGIQALTNGAVIWGTSDMRCMFVVGYTFNAAHQYVSDVAAFEISQGGRAALVGMVVIPDGVNNRTKFDATDLTYTTLAAGDTPTGAIIYKYNVADAAAELLGYIPLPSAAVPDGSDYTVAWNVDGLFMITITGITDPNAIHVNVAAEITTITEKVTPIAADVLLIEDSADAGNKRRIRVGNLPSVTGDTQAIHDNVAGEIVVITEKAIPINSDVLLIEDSAAANVKKRVQIGNLPSSGSGPDDPPVTPNACDDEFTAAVLDGKWAWIRAGAPAATSGILSEAWGLVYSKLWMRVIKDSGTDVLADAHAISQTVPVGAWTITTKATYGAGVNYNAVDLWIDDGSNNNADYYQALIVNGVYETRAQWVIATVTTANNFVIPLNSTTVYLRLSYVSATPKIVFYVSVDGIVWSKRGEHTIGYVPARFGIAAHWNSAGGGDFEHTVSFEYFRVTSP